ncbi:MFS transporter [Parvibium lacunae]|nr:MFS transporter [Parvibium lacunae]
MTTSPLPLGASSWRADTHIIAVIGIAHGTSHFFQLALPALFPALKQDLQLTYAELGMAMTCFYVVSGVFQALSGFVVDRLGAVRVLLFGLLCLAVGAGVASLAQGQAGLYLGAALIGLGNSVFHPADFSLLNARVSLSRLGHAFSTHALSGNLGYIAAPLTMLALSHSLGWRVALQVAMAIAIAVALFVFLQRQILDGGHHAQQKANHQPLHLQALLTRPIIACFFFFLFATFAVMGLQNFLPTLLQSAYALTPVQATSMLTTLLLGGATGMLLGGFAANRAQHHERIAAGGMIAAALIAGLLAAHLIPTPGLLPVLFLLGLVAGITNPSRDMLVRKAAPPGASGRVYGMVYAGLDTGAATGPAVLGWLLDQQSPHWAFLCVAIAFSLNVVLAGFARQSTMPVTR